MNRWLRSACVLLSLVLLVPLAVQAQATGQINGIVTDTSGGVLPGVTVEATSPATGATRTAVTGADGLYTIPLLQPGDYNVRASLTGFRASLREGVRVTVTETSRVAFVLDVGQVTETVTVVADATLVETSNATRGIVIDQQKVVDLPLNGRNFTQLGTLIQVWWRLRRDSAVRLATRRPAVSVTRPAASTSTACAISPTTS